MENQGEKPLQWGPQKEHPKIPPGLSFKEYMKAQRIDGKRISWNSWGGKLNLFPTTKGRKDKHKKAVLNQESGKQAARLGTPSNGSLQGQQREQITDDNAAEYGLTESGGDDEEPNGAKKTVSATGPGFSSSTKFPPTLWAATDTSLVLSLRAPQIHVINGEETSRSKLNSGFNACSEARQVGQSLKLDYFLCSYRVNFFDGTAAIGTIRNYINADLDTLWLTKTKEVNVLPENIQWVCGKCSMFEEGTIRTLLNHEVSEVLIVVGDFERCERMRDVSFVPPSQRPHYVKHAGREAKKWGSQAFKKKWSDMEEDIVNMMDDLKLARAEARKRAMNHGLDLDFLPSLEDLSGWKIPKVRFVEAKTASLDWVRPSKENLEDIRQHWA
ncbi:hypothetical protein L207DRAFT_524378 [Hyaloscypha variabilis F]|uniref:Uncharacterized protein n=1 Tax=Hyaloscypha variabilis (strain UAMH 11265 / GT02V1 / F) TaxID=1149755 RepID=A0A2J6S2E5_HYAVF|nr:hypothetical protein L207DRAFT_524378 [Hyaloscypha variabilis F]